MISPCDKPHVIRAYRKYLSEVTQESYEVLKISVSKCFDYSPLDCIKLLEHCQKDWVFTVTIIRALLGPISFIHPKLLF